MDRDTWGRQNQYGTIFSRFSVDSYSEVNDKQKKDVVSINSILPDDLLETILAYLVVASVFKAGCVCKRWNDIVISKRVLWNFSFITSPQMPWYFMFTHIDEFFGYFYDPTLKKWYSIDLPYFGNSNWFIASSFGLVFQHYASFMLNKQVTWLRL